MKNKLYLVVVMCIVLWGLDSCKKDGGQNIGLVTDIDGNQYKTITLGTQTWMIKNLQTTRYADSTWIGDGSKATLVNDSSQLYYIYNNDSALNLADFGRLYTFAAVTRGAAGTTANPSGIQGPCPNGWHVPSDAEYSTLINYLGGAAVAGGPIKGNADWDVNVGSGLSASGFNALPSGARTASVALFTERDAQCYLWTATDNGASLGYTRIITGGSTVVIDTTTSKSNALSCRCVQN